jgi:hypothetical protein
MKLYFKSSSGEKRLIANPKTDEEVTKEINRFCDDRNFHIYYTRTWIDGDGLKVFDIGSWTEFFLLDMED